MLTIVSVALVVVSALAMFQSADNRRLRQALKPFATFGVRNTDNDGWNEVGVSTMKERIVDWFGPSDFRAAVKEYGAEQALRDSE